MTALRGPVLRPRARCGDSTSTAVQFFSVRGPLNVPRTPQGHPVVIQAGGSEPGKELAAETAEVVFTGERTVERARAFYADLKGRLAKFGRSGDDLKILSGLNVIVEADACRSGG